MNYTFKMMAVVLALGMMGLGVTSAYANKILNCSNCGESKGSSNAAKTLDDVFNYVSTREFGLKQSLIRGGDEGIEAITEPSEKPYTGEQRGDYIQDLEKQIDALSNPQSMNVTPPKPTLAPQQMMSPTILPNEDDREIAMRRQTGIAGLV